MMGWRHLTCCVLLDEIVGFFGCVSGIAVVDRDMAEQKVCLGMFQRSLTN